MAERYRIYTVPTVALNTRMLYRVAELVGGYTVTLAEGGWVNPEGELEVEKAAVIELIGDNPTALVHACHIVEQYAWLSGETAVMTTGETVDMQTKYMEDGEEVVVDG